MTSTPLGAVQQYIDGFNNGDAEMMAATFDAEGSILDGMAPHLWVGPTAEADWYRDAWLVSRRTATSPTIARISLCPRALQTKSAAPP